MINEQCLNVFPDGKPTAISKSFGNIDICDITRDSHERVLCYSNGLVELYSHVAQCNQDIMAKLGDNIAVFNLNRNDDIFTVQIPTTTVSLITRRWDYTGEGATATLLRAVDEVCGDNIEMRNLAINFWGIDTVATAPLDSQTHKRFVHIAFKELDNAG